MRKTYVFASLLLFVSACANPTAPSAPKPTTGALTVRMDAQCAVVQTISADVYIDGQYVSTVASGSSVTQTVSLGTHLVEAATYVLGTRTVLRHWGPASVSVPAEGFTEVFSCS